MKSIPSPKTSASIAYRMMKNGSSLPGCTSSLGCQMIGPIRNAGIPNANVINEALCQSFIGFFLLNLYINFLAQAAIIR